jgi:ubiquinone/menaquinone biosynthesis C-methylase UbiE
MVNQNTYSTPSIVNYYAQLSLLQPAEKTILDLIQTRLVNITMLDIGVGGGRTTQHFAEIATDYIGIDYSAKMIAACQKRFANSSPAIRFEVCDARDMSRFPDRTFDFILFSFNGLDYISHADRLEVFQAVRRIGKPGGYFCFSSHNLQGIEHSFNWQNQLHFNPLMTYVNLMMLALFRLLNRSISRQQLQTSPYLILKDESHNFKLQTYYIRPSEQIKQLESTFKQIRIFSWQSGLEITTESELNSNVEMWLYYLCTFP